jgi:UDP-N-acetylmuramyl tripeptide synthase
MSKARIDPRLSVAVAAGRLTAAAARRTGRGGGTTLPGRVGQRFDPRLLDKLGARLERGSVLVSGTNGKTTTAALLRTVLEAAGLRVVSNRAGSNLDWGLASALLGASGLGGQPEADIGVFEVDEGILPHLARRLEPRLVVVTNLFRDQLDRYGELEASASAVSGALASLPAAATAVLCADDPGVAVLGEGLRAATVFYGLDLDDAGHPGLPHAADARFCRRCGEPFDFSRVYVAHLGVYRCPRGHPARPPLDLAATAASFDGLDGQRLELAGPLVPAATATAPASDAALGTAPAVEAATGSERLTIEVALSGLYNTYNIAAAATAALVLGVASGTVASGMRRFRPAFGRQERLEVDGRTVRLLLAKNPAGFNEVLHASRLLGGGRHFLLSLNDRLADGRDVSWIWDVDFELLGDAESVVVSGDRALDLAVRLEYAGVPPERVSLRHDQPAAIDAALRSTPPGGELHVLPTYTAMLDIRAELASRGHARRFWEEG